MPAGTLDRLAELVHEVRWTGHPQLADDLTAALAVLGVQLPDVDVAARRDALEAGAR